MNENEDPRETNPRMVSSTGDSPVRKKKEDRLNRARFAEVLAERITNAPGTGGVVFGLLGPLAWDVMRRLFGEDIVKHRVEEFTRTRDRSGGISLDERTRLALETAQRYISGWRPDW